METFFVYIVSYCNFASFIMKEKIIHTATDLFLNFGFKSVTMDDISHKLGISKKTIYQHFKNKTQLIEATTSSVFLTISTGIDAICSAKKNPIDEIYEIKVFVMQHLKDEKSSPQYQLKKYYPKIYTALNKQQFNLMQKCVIQNLQRGIKLGWYRNDLDVDFIFRIYFQSMVAIKDKDLFPQQKFAMPNLMDYFLAYHLRGICTAKGISYITKINQIKKTATPNEKIFTTSTF